MELSLYTSTITLILVMDPLGNIPVFCSILGQYDIATQRKIILREIIFAFIILLIFLFFGRYIMHGLHLSTEALSIAGGIILALIALRMIFPVPRMVEADDDEPFIVPMAIPLIAGPSTLATIMLLATKDSEHLGRLFIATTIAILVFLIITLFANRLFVWLGRRGIKAVERLMGMILMTVAVQLFMVGISTYIHSL